VSQVDPPFLNQVQESAGSGHDQVDGPLIQLGHLLAEVRSPVDRHAVEPAVLGQGLGVGGDLDNQLPRRGQDQRAGPALDAVALDRGLEKLREHGDQECGCLACPGLGPARDILACVGLDQGLGLDGRAVPEPQVRYRVQDGIGQTQVVEPRLACLLRDLKLLRGPRGLPLAGLVRPVRAAALGSCRVPLCMRPQRHSTGLHGQSRGSRRGFLICFVRVASPRLVYLERSWLALPLGQDSAEDPFEQSSDHTGIRPCPVPKSKAG